MPEINEDKKSQIVALFPPTTETSGLLVNKLNSSWNILPWKQPEQIEQSCYKYRRQDCRSQDVVGGET